MPEGFGGRIPNCNAALCLNQRHRGAGCCRCVDSCPTDAIRLEGGRPRLDETLCVQCGSCTVVCPTDVFTQINPPEPTLMLTFQHLPPTAPLEVVCPLRSGGAESRAPVAAVVRHRRCLAALSVPHLLEISRQGERPLWLDDSPCADCPFGACHSLLTASVAAANTLLAAFGHPPSLALHTTHPEQLLPAPLARPVLDGMKPQLSRRGFFGALRQMGQERVERALTEEAPPMLRPAVAVDQRLPRRLPHSRKELLAHLSGLVIEDGLSQEAEIGLADLPFAVVGVDADACSACGLCSRFCPTGALHFDGPGVGALTSYKDAAYALDFQARLCIDCAICQVACPEEAIAFGDSLRTEQLLSARAESLVAGKMTACITCGAPVAEHIQPSRCHVCRQGAGKVTPLHDGAGLMTDLLRRSNEPRQ
ncbi:MAG: hypothetical protein DWI57_01475 [Chloroflexi bacterium]|nr:MAG: hypothetical protein DWI57_01475 [Chloroflexota bacterium]